MSEFNSLVQFMDSHEIDPERRDLKLECVKNYSDVNEDSWTVFPKCEHCNPDSRVITIPNKNPVVETHMVIFPKPKEECLRPHGKSCNPEIEDNSQTPRFLIWEEEI